jgi:hypothetical protein
VLNSAPMMRFHAATVLAVALLLSSAALGRQAQSASRHLQRLALSPDDYVQEGIDVRRS